MAATPRVQCHHRVCGAGIELHTTPPGADLIPPALRSPLCRISGSPGLWRITSPECAWGRTAGYEGEKSRSGAGLIAPALRSPLCRISGSPGLGRVASPECAWGRNAGYEGEKSRSGILVQI
jgi:hypothetical protein